MGICQVRCNASVTSHSGKSKIRRLEITTLLAVCRAIEHSQQLTSEAIWYIGNILETVGERADAEAVIAVSQSASSLR